MAAFSTLMAQDAPLPILDPSIMGELDAALKSGSEARRIDMLARIADVFAADAPRYSEEQLRLFDELMVRLIESVGPKARAALAAKLAPIENAPSGVVHALAFDHDIQVAGPVLTRSERLTEPALLASAKTKSLQHLLAVSRRRALGEAVTDLLIERGDRKLNLSTARNRSARISDFGFRLLVKWATGDDELAAVVGMRPDIPRPHFLVLLENASRNVRAQLAAANPQAESAAEKTVNDVVSTVDSNAPARQAAMLARLERQHRLGQLTEMEIARFASDHKLDETTAGLAIVCDMPADVVERALLDRNSELTLILAKVAGLTAESTRAVLALRGPEHGASSQDIERALDNYDRLPVDTACRVLGFFRDRAKGSTGSASERARAVNSW
ncbi:MAG TPA: DUF2336 domain-containing protein [Xanthobacteraceae bacterium]|jgi:uncharacterized protein (DUF2336 family)